MIWGQVAATSIVAGMVTALAVPMGRKLLLGDLNRDWLQNELELDRIEVDNSTIRGKDNSLSRVWRLRGISYDAKVEQEQITLLHNRAALIRELGKKGLHVRLLAIKRQRPISYEAHWPSSALAEIGEAEAAQFKASYYVEWYILASGFSMKPLLDAHKQIISILSKYDPVLLERQEEKDNPCELTGFLNGLISGEYRDELPPLSSNLSGTLPGSDFGCDKQTGLITTYTPHQKFHKVITVSLWPESVSGRLIGDLLGIPGDLEICQICEPWDRDQATILFERRKRGYESAFLDNPAGAVETKAVLDLLGEDAVTLFTTQFQIIVRAENEKDLNQLVEAVCQTLGDRRVLHRVQTIGAPTCWFNRLPTLGRRKKKLMPGGKLMAPLDLRDDNLAALWAFPHSALGMTKSQYGDAPVRMFRTPSGQAYAMQFQTINKPQALGNYLVFAPSGGGKSTLMMHLLGGLAKFDGVPSYIFDSKEGAKFMIEALGGVYQGYDTLSLNPLDVGADTPSNRNRVYTLLRSMAGAMKLTPEDKDALTHATELSFQLDPPQRTLSFLFPFAFSKRTDLRREFSKWVTDDKGNKGIHHHVFNAAHDSLGGLLNHFMVGINMNEALDDPELGPPVVAHIAAAIGKSAASSAKGFNIFIDEAAKLLQNPGFRSLAAEMFREYRKLNGAVGLAFQDPKALLDSGMSEAFIMNTATFIFLPNAQAEPDSFKAFNLNDEQMNFVLGRSIKPEQRRVLIIKRDAANAFDESAIVDVNLSPLGDPLKYYRAGVDANTLLTNLKNQWGDQWPHFV
ncbi:MAG: type IV secretion system protein VirB4 [Alphaproteobacteria bacterium]|nr:type IV secretion system protein VirB4 [Rhodospirillales bacterium]MCW9045316.1 type IV secretion system protein VirB4 [Alphaproteobacteria bacterium]